MQPYLSQECPLRHAVTMRHFLMDIKQSLPCLINLLKSQLNRIASFVIEIINQSLIHHFKLKSTTSLDILFLTSHLSVSSSSLWNEHDYLLTSFHEQIDNLSYLTILRFGQTSFPFLLSSDCLI